MQIMTTMAAENSTHAEAIAMMIIVVVIVYSYEGRPFNTGLVPSLEYNACQVSKFPLHNCRCLIGFPQCH